MLMILATWEAQIRRTTIQDQPGNKVHKTPSQAIAGPCGTGLTSQAVGGLHPEHCGFSQPGQISLQDPISAESLDVVVCICHPN
jgi:hypothetical protein